MIRFVLPMKNVSWLSCSAYGGWECCVPLDPAPNLVHHLFSHMTSHGVGCGSGLLPAFYGHKEVAEARIHSKLHVAAPTQGVLPDLEILSRDLVVAPA